MPRSILPLAFALCLTACATPERIVLPVKLQVQQSSQNEVKINFLDTRPASDRLPREVQTSIGFLITLGDDATQPPATEYLARRLSVEAGSALKDKTIKISRLVTTTESRSSWGLFGYKPPGIVGATIWEQRNMHSDFKSKIETMILLEVDGQTHEAKSYIPFDSAPTTQDIANSLRLAVDNMLRTVGK